jgi:predicted RNA-binding protein with PIN domain
LLAHAIVRFVKAVRSRASVHDHYRASPSCAGSMANLTIYTLSAYEKYAGLAYLVYDSYMAPPDLTTIKVSKALRDRISTGAAEQHQTVQKFIERVLEDYERHRRLTAVATALATADEDTLDEWRAETDTWASADSDLDGAP